MVKTWARHKTTETVLNKGWRLVAVGGWCSLGAVLKGCPKQKQLRFLNAALETIGKQRKEGAHPLHPLAHEAQGLELRVADAAAHHQPGPRAHGDARGGEALGEAELPEPVPDVDGGGEGVAGVQMAPLEQVPRGEAAVLVQGPDDALVLVDGLDHRLGEHSAHDLQFWHVHGPLQTAGRTALPP